MQILKNAPLADYTSFGTGGTADNLIIAESARDLLEIVEKKDIMEPVWLFGYGTDSLISDKGLRGSVIFIRGGDIKLEEIDNEKLVVADAGTVWDEVVVFAIEKQLWGLELMSGIPGGVGAAVVGNIAAYGQAVSDSLVFIDIIDKDTHLIKRISKDELDFSYRYSAFQTDKFTGQIIISAAFKLSPTKTTELEYASATLVAKELGEDIDTLSGRRKVIIEARRQAGSILVPHENKNAGSFFKNPFVRPDQVEAIVKFDESGKAKEQILKQQQIHGGSTARVSAALVMLAAGFHRGQTWGPVRLHPNHVLKIENTGSASSQQIYEVAQEIITTVKEKLDIVLEPEVRFVGEF